MNKYEKALNEIKESYDAFYFPNKYGDNTHKEQFELLATLPNLSLERGALAWIKYEYDCYYKDEYKDEKGTAFEYIRKIIKELEEVLNDE